MKQLLKVARGAGPYVLVALLVPGGSLIALAAWLFRNQKGHDDISPASGGSS